MAAVAPGPRFRPPAREELSERQQEFYRLYTTGPRASASAVFRLSDEEGNLMGPPAAWILAPEIGLALERFGYQMRYGIHVSDKAREAAILAVGYELRSPFELYAHERAGRAAGWTDEDLAAIAARRMPEGADEQVRTVLTVAWTLLERGTLSEEEYAQAEGVLGVEHLFEIVTLVGYYRMVAMQLAVFRILPPSD